ncbi:MAG: hypothetical protein QOG54_766 [Actinomycetota bacterium]|nr:hypothetical protein [Actinomycetota bacterium]
MALLVALAYVPARTTHDPKRWVLISHLPTTTFLTLQGGNSAFTYPKGHVDMTFRLRLKNVSFHAAEPSCEAWGDSRRLNIEYDPPTFGPRTIGWAEGSARLPKDWGYDILEDIEIICE